MEVTIGGEPRHLGEFSAYKAFKAMETVAAVEEVWREVLNESARFKRNYESEHFVELDRTTARRHFAPLPLWETINDGEQVIERPLLDSDGQPIAGPDPLGHLTEQDWAASGHRLRLPDSPSENLQMAAMIPVAFRLGRDQVMRLLAIAVTANAEIERWDAEGAAHVDDELDRVAKDLLHRCRADELIRLAGASLELFKEQVSGPFGELVAAVRTTFASPASEQEETTDVPPAMTVEQEESTPGSPTSSSGSPGASAGSPSSSPTELASASSSGSASG
jgi:hypothetical protein